MLFCIVIYNKLICKSKWDFILNIQLYFFRLIYFETLKPDRMPTYGYSDMIDLVVDGHHSTLTRKSCKILMKRGMYPIENNKYMFSRDIRLKVTILFMVQ